ncbi:hypothetical protein OC842_000288 [Tilletia horrida]|uniref:TIGR02453 family protein n=1 Tax=Tilletia horrida TaxID=155126 RepID=A0AAN6GH99_9BASI|nr:hypothetical protein OC842_000288 [Tilletia horrida]
MPPRRASSSASSSPAKSSKSPRSSSAAAGSSSRRTSGRVSASSAASYPATKSKSRSKPAAKPKAASKSRSSSSRPSRSQTSRVQYADDDDEDDEDEDEDQDEADDSADDFQILDDRSETATASENDAEEQADDDEDDEASGRKSKNGAAKRKASSSSSKTKTPAKKQQKTSRQKKAAKDDEDDDDDEFEGDEDDPKRTRKSLGFVKAGVGAPTKGHVPATQVSPHLFNLLKDLQDPAKNDRDWFKERDKLWRYCEKTWLDFIETLTEKVMEKGDDTIPYLPAKDITYRIYRDVRFSHSKVPYKTEVQVTFSRTGRKGNWAGYHLSVSPGNSYFAGGKWHPDKDELGKIRQHILDDTALGKELKQVVRDKTFVKMFGAPVKNVQQIKDGHRQNLWGGSDQLKISPKIPGLEPDHPDMHWLRLKSFSVYYPFRSDDDVLSPDFQGRICEVMRAMRPLVSVMNRMVFGEDIDGPPPPGESGDEEAGEEDGVEEDQDEDEDE